MVGKEEMEKTVVTQEDIEIQETTVMMTQV
jgi:hypothetical protein